MSKTPVPMPNADGNVEAGKAGVVCLIVRANINLRVVHLLYGRKPA